VRPHASACISGERGRIEINGARQEPGVPLSWRRRGNSKRSFKLNNTREGEQAEKSYHNSCEEKKKTSGRLLESTLLFEGSMTKARQEERGKG